MFHCGSKHYNLQATSKEQEDDDDAEGEAKAEKERENILTMTSDSRERAFKHYRGTKTIEAKDMIRFVFRFVEGLRPEISQMIKSHLICWQAKPIDEVLRYARFCTDEIELKQRKLKEKAMVMQIKAVQTGMQGNFPQQLSQS
ncbi:hypothetical protein NDU88_003048 [Pleurodeles waltl]|uniref:Uncharacterized protein n=1 Tax=Pleurodeles waltl TaxID=8319 RepID=A0AAV7SF20_PLEWA|nr:hypothetical protein NDU88_003048 [Pleurodeles waltl]